MRLYVLQMFCFYEQDAQGEETTVEIDIANERVGIYFSVHVCTLG